MKVKSKTSRRSTWERCAEFLEATAGRYRHPKESVPGFSAFNGKVLTEREYDLVATILELIATRVRNKRVP